MKILSSSATSARLCLLVILATFIGESSVLAWCRGDDGHTRLEQASVMGCIDKAALLSSARGQAEAAAFDADRDCGPCVDYLLDGGKILFSKRPHRLNKNLKVFIDAQNSPLAWSSPGQFRSASSLQHPPGINQTLVALRTVVLLN